MFRIKIKINPPFLVKLTVDSLQASMQIHEINRFKIVLSYRFNTSFDPNLDDHVLFFIMLGKDFPERAPQVHIGNNFVEPSLKGYADYFKIITGGDWHVSSRLKEITEAIPLFILKLEKQVDPIQFAQKNGVFHPGGVYPYGSLKELSVKGPFIAFDTEEERVHLYVIEITSAHFIIFKPKVQPSIGNKKLNVPKESQIDLMRVVFMAEIQSLIEMHHNREEKNEYTFIFGGEQIKNSQISVHKKKLKITKSTQMIELLLKNYKWLKIEIQLESGATSDKSQEQQLLKEVSQNQKNLKHKFNAKTIQELNESYLNMVEFYSSINLPYQEIYLRKVSQLLVREDVRLIMNQ